MGAKATTEMTGFQKVLRIVDGRDPVPPALAAAMNDDPVLAHTINGLRAEAAGFAPNWAAIVAVIIQLLNAILPFLGG